jgi:hypothetical protein
MWLAAPSTVFWRDEPILEAGGMERLARELAALATFASEIDGKLAGAGVDGLDGAADLHRRLHAVLDGISCEELGRMAARVQQLVRELEDVERRMTALRELKTVLARVVPPVP